jgi:hypothetical protein
VPGGVVHQLPEDLRAALVANPAALDAWKDISLFSLDSGCGVQVRSGARV